MKVAGGFAVSSMSATQQGDDLDALSHSQELLISSTYSLDPPTILYNGSCQAPFFNE